MIPLALFIIDCFLVQTGIIKDFDLMVFYWLRSFESPVITKLIIMVTDLGGLVGIVGMIVVIFVFDRKFALNCLVISISQQIINKVFKFIFRRPRPCVLLLTKETGFSFPSGHAMAISCLYAVIIAYLYRRDIRYKYVLISICGLIMIIVCLSRVYLGVHYFSDVFGGAMLSFSLVLYLCNKNFLFA